MLETSLQKWDKLSALGLRCCTENFIESAMQTPSSTHKHKVCLGMPGKS